MAENPPTVLQSAQSLSRLPAREQRDVFKICTDPRRVQAAAQFGLGSGSALGCACLCVRARVYVAPWASCCVRLRLWVGGGGWRRVVVGGRACACAQTCANTCVGAWMVRCHACLPDAMPVLGQSVGHSGEGGSAKQR